MSLYVARPVYEIPDVDEALREIESALNEMEPSTVPSFLNSWVDFGGTSLLAGFYKSNNGIVYLEGAIKNGTLGQPCFNLPRYYRPAGNIIFDAASDGSHSEILIGVLGNVIPNASGSNVSFSLNGIHFRAKAEK